MGAHISDCSALLFCLFIECVYIWLVAFAKGSSPDNGKMTHMCALSVAVYSLPECHTQNKTENCRMRWQKRLNKIKIIMRRRKKMCNVCICSASAEQNTLFCERRKMSKTKTK